MEPVLSPWPESVEAELNYVRNTGVRPVNYTYDPPPGVPRNSGEVDTRRVTVRNARLASRADLSLDSSGFQLLSHRSALADAPAYVDDARIRDTYYREVEDVQRIRNHPLIAQDVPIHGYIDDVRSGRLVEVPGAREAGRARDTRSRWRRGDLR